MRCSQIIEVARSEFLDDTVLPYKWSDAYLFHLGSNAERESCERALLILDKTHATENDVYTGYATSTLSGALVDSTKTFVSATVSGMMCYNLTQNTWSPISAWASGTQLTLVSDIMTSGDQYIIGDSSKALTRIAVKNGQREYALSEKIISIHSARLASDGRRLTKKTEGHHHFPHGLPEWYNEYDQGMSLIPMPGPSLNHYAGVDTLIQSVYRRPLNDWDIKNQSATPEIASQYHLGLVDWICHLAYSKQDAETFDSSKRDYHAANFTKTFGPQLSASVQQIKKTTPSMWRLRGARW